VESEKHLSEQADSVFLHRNGMIKQELLIRQTLVKFPQVILKKSNQKKFPHTMYLLQVFHVSRFLLLVFLKKKA